VAGLAHEQDHGAPDFSSRFLNQLCLGTAERGIRRAKLSARPDRARGVPGPDHKSPIALSNRQSP